VSALAHVFEAAGIHTAALISVRSVAERMQPPRALYCEFPLGRPLGKPGDADFQRGVLTMALGMVESASEPTLMVHPEVIEADTQPLVCALPPRFDPDVHPAVDEARGLRRAFDRSVDRRGVTSVGRVLTPDEIGDALERFVRIADGEAWADVGIAPADFISTVHDIRTYYEEAALELVDGPVPGGRAAEEWFYEKTEAGAAIMGARRAMRTAEAPHPLWFYLAPAQRR